MPDTQERSADQQRVLFAVAHRTVERQLHPVLHRHYELTSVRLRREAMQALEGDPLPDLILVDVPSIRFDVTRFFESLEMMDLTIATFLLLGKGMRLDQMPKAHGYLRHPFSSRQLLARLRRVLPPTLQRTVEWRGLCLDTESNFLIWDERHAPVTPKVAALSRMFLTRPDEIITREELMKEVWGTDYMGDTRTLDVHIHWFREALTEVGAPFELMTQRSVGYYFVASDF
jgi:two-component system alkaline phosphatase synthesis response regulator PhoP